MPVPGWRRVEHVMGMPVVLDVRDDGVDEAIADDVFAWLHHVDATFSTYREDSEISRFNSGDLEPGELSDEVREVLERCEEARIATSGYFDVRFAAPGRIDPSGLVKGWSVDRAAVLLTRAGVRNYALNAGGDIRVTGGALPEPVWRIGIEHPVQHDRVAAVVATSGLAIATSGAYARGDHVLDPHKGLPPDSVLSVTITGSDLATADAYATAAFAMGEEGPAWTTTLQSYEALIILADERVFWTSGFPRVS